MESVGRNASKIEETSEVMHLGNAVKIYIHICWLRSI